MDVLRGACLTLLGLSGVALLVAGRLPRPGSVRGRVYPLAVSTLSVACLVLTVVVAARFDLRAAVPLAGGGVFLGIAGRQWHALLVGERDRLVRRLRADRAARQAR